MVNDVSCITDVRLVYIPQDKHLFAKTMNYIAELASICPPNAMRPTARFPRCYAGVSIGHPNFRGARLRALLTWIAQHFDKCQIVFSDDLYRLSVMIKLGLSESEALDFARYVSRTQLEEIEKGIGHFPPDIFTVVRWRELTGDSLFPRFRESLDELLKKDPAFRHSVMMSAAEYMERRPDKEFAVSYSEALNLCKRYLLEEIAVFGVLVRDGWTVDIYPGPELPILAEMSSGRHENAPEPLHQRVGISLNIHEARLKEAT